MLLQINSHKMGLNEYHIVGRRVPTEADPSPQLYRMRIFAPNEVVAKSRFWWVQHCVAGDESVALA